MCLDNWGGAPHGSIMIKPDGVQRGLVGDIIKRFEQKGFKLVALKLMHASNELLAEHYKDLATKPFFPGLIAYMSSGPVVAMVWEGLNAVSGTTADSSWDSQVLLQPHGSSE